MQPCTDTETLCTGYGLYRGIALLFLDHGTRRGEGVSVTPRPLYSRDEVPVPILQEAGWAPGPGWTGAENLVPPTPGFDPRTVQPSSSVAIPTELPGPQLMHKPAKKKHTKLRLLKLDLFFLIN